MSLEVCQKAKKVTDNLKEQLTKGELQFMR